MAKKQLSIRLEATTLDRIAAFSEGEGITRGAAIEALLIEALEASERATRGPVSAECAEDGQTPIDGDSGPRMASHGPTQGAENLRAVMEVLRESNADLRATVSTLTAQLAVKDGQIRAAHDIADHAQALHAMETQRLLGDGGGEISADTAEGMTWRQRIGRWIAGR